MTLEADIERGQRAARLLDDALLMEAFDTIEAGFLAQMKTGGPLDSEDCMRLVIGLRASVKARDWLTGLVAGGEHARKELELKRG